VPLGKDGNPTGPPTPYNTSLDFRQRNYYLQARTGANTSVFLSLLYSIQSYPVILAATPVKDNVTGETRGVVTISQTLDELSQYVSGLDLKGGQLLVSPDRPTRMSVLWVVFFETSELAPVFVLIESMP
jgi:hypothetical protein